MGKVCSKCLRKEKSYRKDKDRAYVAQNEQKDDSGKILTNKGAAIDPRDVSDGAVPAGKKTGDKKQPEEQTATRKKQDGDSRRKTRRRRQSSEESSSSSTSSSDSDVGTRRSSRRVYRNSSGGTSIITKTFNNYGQCTTIKNVDNVVLNIGSGHPRPRPKKPQGTNQQKTKTADPKPANAAKPEPSKEFFSSYHTQDTMREWAQPVTTSPITSPVGFLLPACNNFQDVNTLEKVLSMSGSVCKLVFPGGFATGIRCGPNYVMVPFHVLPKMLGSDYPDFARRYREDISVFEPLKRDCVYSLFNYNTTTMEPLTFHFDAEVHFCDEETDIAVLTLLPNDDGQAMPPPFKYFSIAYNEFMFIGHPNGETKKMESVKKFVRLNDVTKMEIVKLREWSLNKFRRPYDEDSFADSVHRLLFHSDMINGASGSPGLALVDGKHVVVVTIFLHKYPDWLYDKDVPQADKNQVPENYRISQGANMFSVYDKMNHECPELCEEIFHSWQDQH